MTINDIQDILTELLDIMDISYKNISITDVPFLASKRITVESEESGILIGTKGEHLFALQNIIKRVVEARLAPGEECEPYMIDVNDYNLARINAIKKRAVDAAGRVRMFRHDVELEPMSSYERLIVHAVLASERDIATVSNGEGAHRRITVTMR